MLTENKNKVHNRQQGP